MQPRLIPEVCGLFIAEPDAYGGHYYSEWFEEGDIIDVEAESKEGVSFHFFVCDDEELSTNKRRWVNFEYFEGKENTTQFKKRFEIPFSGMLHFMHTHPMRKNTPLLL